MQTITPIEEALWQLLDDIDTADDWARSNDTAFRNAVRKIVQKRHQYLTSSDGYTLERVDAHAGEG